MQEYTPASALFFILLFFIFSNSKTGIEKDIVAKWHNREESDIFLIFTEDNFLTLQDGNIYIDGTYSFISEDKIEINMSYSGIDFSLICNVNIQHDILTLSNIIEPQNILGTDGMTLTFDLVE